MHLVSYYLHLRRAFTSSKSSFCLDKIQTYFSSSILTRFLKFSHSWRKLMSYSQENTKLFLYAQLFLVLVSLWPQKSGMTTALILELLEIELMLALDYSHQDGGVALTNPSSISLVTSDFIFFSSLRRIDMVCDYVLANLGLFDGDLIINFWSLVSKVDPELCEPTVCFQGRENNRCVGESCLFFIISRDYNINHTAAIVIQNQILNCHRQANQSYFEMITNKSPLNQASIIGWVYNHLYIFSNQDPQTRQLIAQNEKHFGKALASFRKYLDLNIRPGNPGVKINGLGIIYAIEYVSSRKQKRMKTKLKHSPSFLLQFTQLHPQKHPEISYQQLEYDSIAGQVFLPTEFVRFVIDSYIGACLKLAMMEPDRKLVIELGIGRIQILGKKVQFRQRDRAIENKEDNWMFSKNLMRKNEVAQQTWKESLEGTISSHLNIKQIKKNFDKAASVTYKYNQMMNKEYF